MPSEPLNPPTPPHDLPAFPLTHRPRRLRLNPRIRRAVADVHLTPADLVLPLFITTAIEPQPVVSMPGVFQWPVKRAVETITELSKQGLNQFLLFGVTPPDRKDPLGSFADSPDAPVNQTLHAVRQTAVDALLITDLCFCEYTDHGHCGPLCDPDPGWTIDNDLALHRLAQTAVVQARCGADVIAPSGMIDGQVAAIRRALDAANFHHVAILSYSVKFASSFYGPFRDAGGGQMKFGDRRGYQMDPTRTREWRTELLADLAQGADMVMVKPAIPYLDVLSQARSTCDLPLAAYDVSGHYAMLHAAAQRNWLDLKPAALESTLAIKRAGADLIVTYFAPDLLQWIEH